MRTTNTVHLPMLSCIYIYMYITSAFLIKINLKATTNSWLKQMSWPCCKFYGRSVGN